MEVNFNLSLCYYEEMKTKKDKRKFMGLEKSALRTKVPHTIYKGTHE
jgi:hypothetical protein